MTTLVALEDAKAHLRVDTDDEDALITDKAAAATAIVLDYVKAADEAWTVDTVPSRIRAAILLVLTNLYANRGDGEAPTPLSQPVTDCLFGLRYPTFA